MKEGLIANIGISMIDVGVDLSAQEDKYRKVQDLLKIPPGGWTEIKSDTSLSALLALITDRRPSIPLTDLSSLQEVQGISLYAGSTGLSVMSALTPDQRRRSSIYSTVGTRDGNSTDAFGQLFTQEALALGIEHKPLLKIGSSPLGFVIASTDHTDKMLATYKGISQELDAFSSSIKPELLIVDSYELTGGKIADTIKNVIVEEQLTTAIGLGNEAILDEKLTVTLNGLFNSNSNIILYGNNDEYAKLLKINPTDISIGTLKSVGLHNKVKSALVTLGQNGLIGMHEGKYLYQPAFRVNSIVNTDGAGDTAAGAFLSGLIYNMPLNQVLYEASYFAAQVLQTTQGKIPGGRS